jgi:hypothetical protein
VSKEHEWSFRAFSFFLHSCPYSAVSLTDFWRRWHISLSRWFRDYLDIPRGGQPQRGCAHLPYVVLRLGEISGQPTEDVIKKYKSGKGQGWGALAKSLGIKPGSKEFKELKNGDDLYDKSDKGGSKGKDKEGKNKKKK